MIEYKIFVTIRDMYGTSDIDRISTSFDNPMELIEKWEYYLDDYRYHKIAVFMINYDAVLIANITTKLQELKNRFDPSSIMNDLQN